MSSYVIAADIGGTNFRAATVSDKGEITERRDAPTPPGAGPEQLLEALAGLLETIAMAGKPARAACLAVPGLVNAMTGTIVIAPNVPGFRNLQLGPALEQRLGMPVVLENDASAAALGELRFGAARGVRHLVHITAGTGIGGGIIVDGRLYRGANGFAGEIGHIVMDPAGPVCNCGARGCLESLVSGVALATRARRLLANGVSPTLRDIVGVREPTGADLFAAAKAGDKHCEAEIRHAGHVLGLGIGSLVNVLNPEMVTLSGGMLVMGEMLLEPMHEGLRSMAYGSAGTVEVRITELADEPGLLGAAAVAFALLDIE
jgi:glucokinase